MAGFRKQLIVFNKGNSKVESLITKSLKKMKTSYLTPDVWASEVSNSASDPRRLRV